MRSLNSTHSQRNFEVTARRFLAELRGLRAAAVEDVRDALTNISAGLSEASARESVLRMSLLGYASALGYTPVNAGATIKARSDAGSRGLLCRWPPSLGNRLPNLGQHACQGRAGTAFHHREGRQGAPGLAA